MIFRLLFYFLNFAITGPLSLLAADSTTSSRIQASRSPSEKAAADAAWASLTDLLDNANNAPEDDRSMEYLRWYQLRRREFRDRGVEYWEQFPEDTRRYEWLLRTAMFGPHYWQDMTQGASAYKNGTWWLAVVDEQARAAWEQRYTVFRTVYFADPGVSDRDKNYLRELEIGQQSSDLKAQIANAERDLSAALIQQSPAIWRLAREIMDMSSRNDGIAEAVPASAKTLISITSHDPRMEASLLSSFRQSNSSKLRDLALVRESFLNRLREHPVNLKLPTLDGGEMDLSKLRGKVVLLEFWNVSCSSCVAVMPKLETTYERYRDSGFEVASVYVVHNPNDKENERVKAIDILRRQGVTYSNGVHDPWLGYTGILNRSRKEAHAHLLADPINQFFDFHGGATSFSFLLDRQGRLVTTDISGRWLEQEIRRLLGLSASANAPAEQK